jgi:hypothetical protein
MSKDQKNDDKTYDVYLGEREKLISSLAEETHKFDKAILTLSGGAFGFSLAFIKDIVPTIKGGTFFWLLASWAGFGLSLLSTMISFLASQGACRKQIEILEQDFFGEEKQEKQKKQEKLTNRAAGWTLGLNITSIAAFILGVILLVVFVAINVPH